MVSQARAVVSAAGGTAPVWVTETGVAAKEGDAAAEQTQASGLLDIYRSLRAAGVPVVVVHRLWDYSSSYDMSSDYGIIGPDGSRRPAYCVLAAELRDHAQGC